MNLPIFYSIQQLFENNEIRDVVAELDNGLEEIRFRDMFVLGEKIAITVGSRGIDNLDIIIKNLVCKLQEIGVSPFIVPSMGSHGGATAEGQVEVLKSLGISQEKIGVPIISNMEVVELGKTSSGVMVYMDKNALNADGVIVVNRVKPHTRFKARNESGLMKMISVGLGKHKGCIEIHNHGIYPAIVEAARLALEKAPIRLGIGLVENAYDRTAKLRVVPRENLEVVDAELLEDAKKMMPSLPMDDIDLIVVKEMGKDISGTGMDVNVLGRVTSPYLNEIDKPRIKRIVAMDITSNSHGNALGMGLADVVSRRLANKIDFNATYANVVSAGVLDRGKMPVVMESDQEVIQVALQSIERLNLEKARIVFVRNTLELGHLTVSESIYKEVVGLPNIKYNDEPFKIELDEQGNLTEDWWNKI
ncbi:MAG: lactate racemase domain-containing protein [Peptococcaceae bacterium]